MDSKNDKTKNNTMAEEVSVESVLRKCGDFGRYQLIHYTFLNLICIGGGVSAFYYIFGAAEPSFRCRLPLNVWPDNDQFEFIDDTHQSLVNTWISSTSKCNTINGSKCTDFVYDRSVFGRTFTEYSNFVCDNAVKRTWLSTAYQIGPCSTLITGSIGDKIGRRKVIQVLTVGGFIITFVIQLFLQFFHMTLNAQFALLLANQLVSSIGSYSMAFLLLMELTSSSHTSFAGNLALISYTFGEVLATIFAYLALDWLKLKWFISGYSILVLLYLYFIPESPYWLFAQKKYSQLEVCFRKIATINRHKDIEWLPQYEQLVQNSSMAIKNTKRTKKRSIGRFVPRLCVSGLIAFVSMLLYIKISYGLGAMNNTFLPHWNIIIGAAVEAIGYASASFLITTRLGRKYALMVYALLTSACVIIIPFIRETYPIVTIVVSQMGKLMISGAVSVSWIFVPELLPTWMRGFGNAIFVCIGRIGAILAPIIDAAVGDKYIKITFYVYSGLTIIMIGIVLLLPETRNRSFDDGEQDDVEKNNHEVSIMQAETQ